MTTIMMTIITARIKMWCKRNKVLLHSVQQVCSPWVKLLFLLWKQGQSLINNPQCWSTSLTHISWTVCCTPYKTNVPTDCSIMMNDVFDVTVYVTNRCPCLFLVTIDKIHDVCRLVREDGGTMDLWNPGNLPLNYTTSQPRRPRPEISK